MTRAPHRPPSRGFDLPAERARLAAWRRRVDPLLLWRGPRPAREAAALEALRHRRDRVETLVEGLAAGAPWFGPDELRAAWRELQQAWSAALRRSSFPTSYWPRENGETPV